jgi:hypothetical protein
MHDHPVNTGPSDMAPGGLHQRLLEATTAQLRKDLDAPALRMPAVGDAAFEELRAQVLRVLEERAAMGAHAFGLVLNRVDIPEAAFRRTMAQGGMPQLAAAVVLRCLQKVRARERYAGRG